jgi:hypothetical protein
MVSSKFKLIALETSTREGGRRDKSHIRCATYHCLCRAIDLVFIEVDDFMMQFLQRHSITSLRGLSSLPPLCSLNFILRDRAAVIAHSPAV